MARNVSESPVRHRHSPRRSRREECLQSRRSSRSPSPRTKRLRRAQEPSFELSGKLAEETNRYRGIAALLFNEPPEARKPNKGWRLYVFKDELLQLHRQSCYLFGREKRIADIRTDHPSCSMLLSITGVSSSSLEYEVEMEKLDGMMETQVRPYIMDLGSTNKTLASMFLLFHIYCDPLLTERGWLFLVMRSIFTLKAAASLDFGPNIKVTHRDRAEISQVVSDPRITSRISSLLALSRTVLPSASRTVKSAPALRSSSSFRLVFLGY
ncbi:hypothetical protein DY000_02038054 [Brassica cretica]|uniref:Uncharacterized protein n=1 Tax=Brassica cretica TaxID=69181 RepID=A0ABQ7BB22_BRACR|nr:hypothetical protein DY000_02038054 [Brassica cretica]